jgi:hypothetical protein
MSHHPRIKSFEKAPELNQKTKDSLHNEAALRGKPFFSPKHGVNVDPEDGVLVNRPVYTDGTKLTYEIADKPFRSNSSNHFSTPFMAKSPLKDAKFLTSAQPPVMDPERNIDMTEQERAEGREALTDAVVGGVSLNPTLAGASSMVRGTGAGAKALMTGGFGQLVRRNANKIGGFIAKKLGMKGTTAGAQHLGKM